MEGLPPVFLHVGEDEVLLDDVRHYATQVEGIGGSVDLPIWQGMVHVFPANWQAESATPNRASHVILPLLSRRARSLRIVGTRLRE